MATDRTFSDFKSPQRQPYQYDDVSHAPNTEVVEVGVETGEVDVVNGEVFPLVHVVDINVLDVLWKSTAHLVHNVENNYMDWCFSRHSSRFIFPEILRSRHV